jgi:ribose transport system ATP-binding protein
MTQRATGPMVLRMRGVAKAFGPTRALRGVDLEVGRGEVHALVGENGAGKSTLMKVLSGALAPDRGEIEFDGAPYRASDPLAARAAGVAMIYQELSVALHLTVEQNVMLGREESRFGIVARAAMRERVARALEFLAHPDLEPRRRLIELSPAARQLVEIARALAFDSKLIVMDEPTSSLGAEDVERLFAIVGRLRDRGVSVIYISHFLEEVRRVASRFTVLRDGETVASGDLDVTSDSQLIAHMVGRDVAELFPRTARKVGEVVLELDALSGVVLPRGASLSLRRGEVLGVAGLVGAGRTELLRALYGLDAVASGRVTIGGSVDAGATPDRRLAQGVGLLSENRKEEGLALGLSIATNATLSKLAPFTRGGFVDVAARSRAATALTQRLNVKCASVEQPIGALSGGNQQKVALARLLHHDVDVLLLDEPTRGIDVGSKAEIYRLIGELAAGGKAVLFVSSYLPELMGVCDRIAVMRRGEVLAVKPTAEWTEHAILEAASRGVTT